MQTLEDKDRYEMNDANTHRRRLDQNSAAANNDTITRSTIRLRGIDRKRLEQIKCRHRIRTDNKAIRMALSLSTETVDARMIDLSCKILKWAGELRFTCPREQAELYKLSNELYRLVNSVGEENSRDNFSEGE